MSDSELLQNERDLVKTLKEIDEDAFERVIRQVYQSSAADKRYPLIRRSTISKINFLKFEKIFSTTLTWRIQQKCWKLLALWVDPIKKIENLAFKALFYKSQQSKSPSRLVFDSPERFCDFITQPRCPTNVKT